jgi:hypothetical protein
MNRIKGIGNNNIMFNIRFLKTSCCCLVLLFLNVYQVSAQQSLVPVNQKCLFVDDSWIKETYLVNKQIHQAEKLKGNPLIIADRNWEGGVNCFGTVLYDEGKFRMWYQIYNGKEKEDLRFATMVGYAESIDGINWVKPDLGLYEYQGSNKNNIVLTSWGATDLYSPAVIRDDKEPNPARRYKMIYWDSMSEENLKKYGSPFPLGKNVPGWKAIEGEGFFVAFSPDGIHWNKYNTQPVFTCACDASSLTLNADGTFTAYFKMSVRDDLHFRELGKSTSKDFTSWTEPEIILQPDWKDPNGTEFYGMSVSEYFGNTLGLVWMYHNSTDDKMMDIQIASADKKGNWNRAAERKTFIANGSKGEWDAGSVITASTIILHPQDNTLLLYYGGSTTRHDDSRAMHREYSIGLAKLRMDGFVSMDSKLLKGYLITKPIQMQKKLFVNVDASHGEFNVELIDPKSMKVLAVSDKYSSTDNYALFIDFKNASENLIGKEVLLKFNMKKTSLFSFWFDK